MIEDDINRSNVWRIICDNMKLGLISGEEVIKCVISHIGEEDEEYTLPIVLQAVSWIFKYKLSNHEISENLKK